jgi:hypothetical protein
LIVNQIDDEGEENTTEIKIIEDGTDLGPIFDDYTDSVEWRPQHNPKCLIGI